MSKQKSTLNQGDKLLFNKGEYGRVFHTLSHLAKNRFRWDNLPSGMESRFIEEGLFNNGQVAFVEDKELGLLCLPCVQASGINVYGEPLAYNVIGVGYSKIYKAEEVVRIIENEEKIPTILDIRYYSELIENIETTIRLNLNQQKFPYVIPTSDATKRSMKMMYKGIEDGEPALFIDEKLQDRGDALVKVLKTDSPYLLDRLQSFKQEINAEVMSFLGINNTANNKKERLLVDEVNVNNNYILLNLELAYMYRKKACDEINKKFGLNITVTKVIQELEVDFLGQAVDVDGDGDIDYIEGGE